MSPRPTPSDLSRRERQVMDLLYEHGSLTAAELHERLPDPPSYSSVRSMLRVLDDKGHVEFEQQGPRYVWRPKVPRDKARRSALEHLVQTFFEGSPEGAVAALLDMDSSNLPAETVQRILDQIEKAKEEGR